MPICAPKQSQGKQITKNRFYSTGKHLLSMFAFLFMLVIIPGISKAQLAAWPNSWSGIAASPLNATTIGSNVSVAQLARVGLTGVSSSARYNSSNWSGSNYLTVTITANAGFVLNMNSQTISMAMGSSNTGPNAFTLRSSVDGYVASLGSLTTSCSSSSANSITLPSTGFNGLSTITFRIFGTLTGCNGTFGTGGTGGPASVTINGTTAVSSTAPTVTTNSAPSVLTSTAATLGGNVTATGGASITANGIVYALTATNATPAISGTGVTQLATASPGSGTGTFSNSTVAALSVNTQYSYRAYATNVSGTSYGGASGTSFFTLANVPGATTVNAATSNSLAVALNSNGNPSSTQFAIQETSTGNYLQADGSLGASQVWQTATAWGTKTVTGLTAATAYTFQSKARNGAATPVETAFGTSTTKSTLPNTLPAPTVNAATATTLNVTINTNSNPVSTQYAIKETNGNYVQVNGTLGAVPAWQTAAVWGTKTITGLNTSVQYGFQVKARNADNIETAFGNTANKSTLANTPGAPIVDGATFSSLNVTINPNNNSSFTEYAIYETTTGNFVQADGSLSGTPVWQIADVWGTKTVIDLASLSQYTFQVSARNPDLIETGLSATTDGTTLDATTPFLSATTLNGFGSICLNLTTAPESFTLSGQNLTADDITISALNGYSYAIDQAGPYTASLTISQPGGDFSQLIYVQFTPTVTQSYDGNIIAGGGGATNINIPSTGDGINTTPTVVSTGTSGIAIDAATVNANITLTGCSPVTIYGVEYSTVPLFANGTGTAVPGNNINNGIFSVTLNGLSTGTIYYYHSYAINNGGTSYSAEGTFTTLTPTLSVSTLTGFGNVCINNIAGPNTFTVSGTNLSATDVTVASLTGFTYSTDNNTYSPSLSITQPGGTFSQLIYVKFNPTTVQSFDGNIIVGGGTAANVNRPVTGSGINTSATVTTSNAAAITQVSATLAGTITSVGCSVATAYGFEYSLTNGFVNGTGTNVPATNLAGNAFSVGINSLAANTVYYFKAYVTNNGGTSYGSQQSFTTLSLAAPLATNATSILSNSFVANWNAVTGATSYRLDVSTSSTFSGTTNATDLFFSEYIEGSSNNKYLEIYNGTGATVDLSNYKLRLYSNGVTTPTFDVQLSGNLATGNTIVLKNGSATIYGGTAIVNAAVNWNGDDAFDLFKISTGTSVDIFGKIGEDPGTAWTSGALSTLDKTLVRKSSVTGGVTVNPASGFPALASEWDVFNTDDVSHLGAHTYNGNGPSFVTGYNNLTVNGTSQLVSGLSTNTTYYYRVRGFSTNSTSGNSNTIAVQTCSLVPTITGNASFCQGSSTTLTASAASSYQWNLAGSPINGETNQTITITGGGDYSVTVTNGSGCTGTSAITTVTVNPKPATPTISAGSATTFCSGGSVLLTASSATGNQWNLNGAAINGETNQTLSVNASGDYTVTTTNGFGCGTTSVITTVTVNPTPAAPIISAGGPITFCEGGSVLLTSSSLAGNQWNLNGTPINGENNQTFNVNASGDYAVTTTNIFSCSSTSVITTITVNPLPANAAVSIIQPTCSVATGTINITSPTGTNNSYNLDGGSYQPGTSFTLVSPGDHNILVQNNFGCISLLATNATVDPQPFTPSAPTITGIVNVCPYTGTGDQITYTASAPGATAYSWTLPPNVNIISSGGTADHVVVSFNSNFSSQPNKQIRVKASSVCGTSPMQIYYLLAQSPVTPNPITGPTNICELIGTGNIVTYKTAPSASALSYVWTAPANTVVTHPNGPGINDTIINVIYNTGFNGGSITVTAANGCGTSGTRSLGILNIPPSVGLINGPINVCANIAPLGSAATYSVTPVATAGSYTWTTPPNAIVTHPNGSGVNDHTITVFYPAGFVSGTITVSATNGCGTSSIRSLSITKLNPATPGNIDVIQTATCDAAGGRTYSYTLASMPANASSVQWTVPTASGTVLVSGQGTSSITVTYPSTAVQGSITAQAINNCGVSTVRSINVKLPACPSSGFAKSGVTNTNKQTKTEISELTATDKLTVRLFPNPAVGNFKLQVLTSQPGEIAVRILNEQGKIFKSFKLTTYEVIELGTGLNPGIYLVEVRQGTAIKTTKLVRF
ncbi:MAG: lamin tail domain-containing protein [Ferruginibacter sp.]